MAYQAGILIATPTNTIEHMLRDRVGYSWALAGFEVVVIFVLVIVLLSGQEQRGRSSYSGDLLIEKE